MAGFASDGQVGGTVVERPGLYVIRPVAGDAFGAQSAKNAGGGATVAGFAGGHCVSAEKRKAVLVGADLLGGDFPSGNGVAVLAGGAELPAVDIGVAIRALLSNVGEDRLRVAQAAGHAFVHAAQRIAARPRLIVADEPVSALDVSVQAQVLNLMQDLQDQFGLAFLFISHDLGVVNLVCDEVIVLYQGRIVERGPPDTLFREAAHPYTRKLLAAVPGVRRDVAQ